MIIYSFYNEKLAWCNVIIIVPIALFFLFFSIVQIREIIYLDKQGIVVVDRVKHMLGIIMATIISIIMLSSVFNTFYTPYKYSSMLKKGEYYVTEGQPEKVESYMYKTGNPDGVELIINLKGIEFDTGFSYGEKNNFNKDDYNCIKNGTISIKYIYEKTGTYLHPVILEISSNRNTGDGTLSSVEE